MPTSRDQPGDPNVTFSTDVLQQVSAQCRIRGITTKAQWRTAMNTVFGTANWPGIDTTALALLRTFFSEAFDFGGPG